MAANKDDLFMEVGAPGTATTLSAPGYTIANTSITVGSTSNWPSATGVIFAIDEAEVVDGVEVQVAGTYNEYAGTVTSGTLVSNVEWQLGVGDRNYSPGALTRVYVPVSAERENRLAQGLVVAHNQDGTLKTNSVTTAAITDANVTTAKIADDAVTAAKIDWASTGANAGIWWEELGRATLATTANTLGVITIPSRKYLRILVNVNVTSSDADLALRFNADTGTNYASRISINGGADATQTSATGARIFTNSAGLYVADVVIYNNATTAKVITGGMTSSGNTAATSAPDKCEVSGKWMNITNSITSIEALKITGSGTYQAGSSIIILGHD